MPLRRVRATFAGACAAALAAGLLAGCTQESAAPAPVEVESPPPSSAAPSETPSGPPALPDEARGTSRKAAVAFVRHWVDTLNYSADTLDSAPLKALSSPDCDACNAAARAIDEVSARDGSINGHQWRIRNSRPVTATTEFVQVEALVEFSPSEVVKRRGASPVQYDGGETLYVFTVERDAESLRVGRFFGGN